MAATTASTENVNDAQQPLPYVEPPQAETEAVGAELSPEQPLALCCAVDQRGHVFAFDLVANRYWQVARIGVSGTSIAFSRRRRREVFIGMSDHSLHCYSLATNQLVAKLPGLHQSPVEQVSVHPTEPWLLSASQTEVNLWDTEQWKRTRTLPGTKNLGILQAQFSPTGKHVYTLFRDHTVMVWNLETLSMVWKLQLPSPTELDPALPDASAESAASSSKSMAMCKSQPWMAVVQNSSSGPCIHVWDTSDKKQIHEITIPSLSVGGGIREIAFVGPSTVLAVLSVKGLLVFLDASQSQFLCRMPTLHKWKSMDISLDGNLIALQSLDAPSIVSLWSLQPIITQKVKGAVPTFLKAASHSASSGPAKPVGVEKNVPVETPKPTSASKTEIVLETRPREAPPATLYDLAKLTDEHSRLNHQKLRAFLRHFGEYPERYRLLIWRFLLQLPENRASFEPLLERPVHPSLKNFRALFPMKSDRIARGMEKIISCLIYWSPIFENLDYLPSMVFPMVKTFGSDTFSCFEAMMVIVTNWCQHWWEFYPNPPMQVLDMVEDLLRLHDKPLLNHFVMCNISTQIYAWPMLQTIFSEVFGRSEWLKVWDHLFSNPPQFMYFFLVAYLRYSRASLMRVYEERDFKYFFGRVNAVDLNLILGDAYKLVKKTPKSFAPLVKPFTPLERGLYPIFNAYPEYIVNYQKKLREKIRAEEEDYLRKKKITDQVQQLSDELRRDQQDWANAEWTKNDMMEKWWNNILAEEGEYVQRKAKMEAMDKDRRLNALRSIADARQDFVSHHLGNTARRTEIFSKAVGLERQRVEQKLDTAELEEKVAGMETEWNARRNELMRARQDLDRMEKEKLDRILKNRESGQEENRPPVQS